MKVILWSIRTFWYKGFGEKQWKMTSLENQWKNQVKKRRLSWKNSSPGPTPEFSEKCLLCIWRLIWSRYDIKWFIYDIILNIQHIKGPIKNWYEISHLLGSSISVFLSECVVLPGKYIIFVHNKGPPGTIPRIPRIPRSVVKWNLARSSPNPKGGTPKGSTTGE